MVNLEHALAPETSQAAQELTVNGTVSTAAALAERAAYAELSVKGNAVRYTLDGTDPVSSGAGAILGAGIYVWSRAKLAAARFIESAGSAAATIRIQGMRE
jgi:hypothetical protein